MANTAERDHAKPMRWAEYAWIARSEWEHLYVDRKMNEEPVQRYFERHPSCLSTAVSGANYLTDSIDSLFEIRTNEKSVRPCPIPNGIVSRPALPGLGADTPNFLWIRADRMILKPIMIFIAFAPRRSTGLPGRLTPEFDNAVIRSGASLEWFSDPRNLRHFQDLYQIPDWVLEERVLRPKALLIFAEHADEPRGGPKASEVSSANVNVLFCTDQPMLPHPEFSDLVTLHVYRGKYLVTNVAPTFTFNWLSAADLVNVPGIADSVRTCEQMSEARRGFLLSRLPKWQAQVGGLRELCDPSDWD